MTFLIKSKVTYRNYEETKVMKYQEKFLCASDFVLRLIKLKKDSSTSMMNNSRIRFQKSTSQTRKNSSLKKKNPEETANEAMSMGTILNDTRDSIIMNSNKKKGRDDGVEDISTIFEDPLTFEVKLLNFLQINQKLLDFD